jgi:DNA ligase-1
MGVIPGTSEARPSPIWVEDRYDGLRCQLHKVDDRVVLYSTDLAEITDAFLELVDSAQTLPGDVVLEGTIVSARDGQGQPEGRLNRRLDHRGDDLFLPDEIPIRYVVSDLLWRDGQEQIDRPFAQRRQALEAMGPWPDLFELASGLTVQTLGEIEPALRAARARGNNGLVIRDPRGRYLPGGHGNARLELKPK